MTPSKLNRLRVVLDRISSRAPTHSSRLDRKHNGLIRVFTRLYLHRPDCRPKYGWETAEAATYLDTVWHDASTETYHDVATLVKAYLEERLCLSDVLQGICDLSSGNPDFLQGLTPLLRDGDGFELMDDFVDTHCFRISTPSDMDTANVRAAFGLINYKNHKAIARPDTFISKRIFCLLDRATTSPEYQAAVVTLQGGDAMLAMELMQKLLDDKDSKYWASKMTAPQIHRDEIQRLLVKLSQRCDMLPESLFLKGVTTKYEHERIGGFANIYRGRYKGRAVALKRLRCFYSMSEPQVEALSKAFTREALMWRQLRHPNVIPFLGIDNGNFGGSTCIVMPWFEAGSIRDHIQKLVAKPTIAHLNRWLFQIARGLCFLHSLKIVHGDLRGNNVIIDDDGNARLADFGLSVFADGASQSYHSVRGGVAFWLAPELIDCIAFQTSGRPTPASDVYAYGCVCIEVYTNLRPFAPAKDYQASQLVVKGSRPGRPSSLNGELMPDNLWALVQRCWHQQASERPVMEVVEKAFAEDGIIGHV